MDHLRVGPCNRCKKSKIECIRTDEKGTMACSACRERRKTCAWGPNDCILFRKKPIDKGDQNNANSAGVNSELMAAVKRMNSEVGSLRDTAEYATGEIDRMKKKLAKIEIDKNPKLK